jgi:hypothetical protein
MSLRRRLSRLEQSWRAGGCGPDCPPLRLVREGDWYGEPCRQKPPAPCPRCGRPPTVVRIVHDPNFYGNADRLRELSK